MHLGDALVPLVRRKIATAGPARQLAVGFAISEACNDATIAALGDRHDDPTREDMDMVLPDLVAEQGTAMVALMLASYGASDAQCQPVFAAILAEDERFALPEVADFSTDESRRRRGPDPRHAVGAYGRRSGAGSQARGAQGGEGGQARGRSPEEGGQGRRPGRPPRGPAPLEAEARHQALSREGARRTRSWARRSAE